MVTDTSNTVYNCAHCGAPAYWNTARYSWFHFGSVTTCPGVEPVAVTLPVVTKQHHYA